MPLSSRWWNLRNDSIGPAGDRGAPVTPEGAVGLAEILGWWSGQFVMRGVHVPEDLAAGSRLIVWSGGMGEEPFEEDPRTWMGAGQARFEGQLAGAVCACERRGVTLVVRPHAHHAISDAPSVIRLLTREPRVQVLLDPVAMITSSMAAAAEDHVERILSLCAAQAEAGVLGVVVREGGAGLKPGRLEALVHSAPAGWARVRSASTGTPPPPPPPPPLPPLPSDASPTLAP